MPETQCVELSAGPMGGGVHLTVLGQYDRGSRLLSRGGRKQTWRGDSSGPLCVCTTTINLQTSSRAGSPRPFGAILASLGGGFARH
jgi:hypothetical protein